MWYKIISHLFGYPEAVPSFRDLISHRPPHSQQWHSEIGSKETFGPLVLKQPAWQGRAAGRGSGCLGETPSQQCGTDTELGTWKLKLLVPDLMAGLRRSCTSPADPACIVSEAHSKYSSGTFWDI